MGLIPRRARPLLAALPFMLVIGVLAWHARGVDWSAVAGALADVPAPRIALALVLTLATYAALAAYDPVAWRATRRPGPGVRRALAAGFTGYAVSLNVGWSALSGGAVRQRLYGRTGHGLADVARVQAHCIVTTALGYATLAAIALASAPAWWPAWAPGSPPRLVPLALVPALAVVAYVAWSARARGPLRVGRKWALPPPPARVALAQVALGSAHWLLTAAVPFVLLAPPVSFPAFVGVFLVAQVAIAAARVPAGLGVLEGVMVLAFAGALAAPAVIAAFLAYRALYNGLPLTGGLGVLAVDAWRARRAAPVSA